MDPDQTAPTGAGRLLLQYEQSDSDQRASKTIQQSPKTEKGFYCDWAFQGSI